MRFRSNFYFSANRVILALGLCGGMFLQFIVTRHNFPDLSDEIEHNLQLNKYSPHEREVLLAQTRLHCIIIQDISPARELEETFDVIKKTWGPDCDSISFLRNHTSEWNTWAGGFRNEAMTKRPPTDWFVFASVSTFLLPNNIRRMLIPYRNEDMSNFIFANAVHFSKYIPVIIMSGSALQRFSVHLSSHPFCATDDEEFLLSLGRCIKTSGMQIKHTLDEKARHRILPAPPFMMMGNLTYDFLRYPVKAGLDCCSRYPIAIYNVNRAFHTYFHYTINVVRINSTSSTR